MKFFYIFREGRESIIRKRRSNWLWKLMKSISRRRRLNYGSMLLIILLIICTSLPFLFIRTAFLALDSSSLCSSIDCIGRRLGPRFFFETDISLKLATEITTALIEAKEDEILDDERGGIKIDGVRHSHRSFNDLVVDITSSSSNNRQDIKSFASKTRATLLKLERSLKSARQQVTKYRHLASYGVPKTMHCLSLRLAEEYSSNALARSPLPPPEFASCLTNTSHHHHQNHHLVLLTDNVLAASVVVSSTVINSAHPEKLVFHVLTDKKNYAPMHAWFALNPPTPSVVEVKGLHQFDWPLELNIKVQEMLEIHRVHYNQCFSSRSYKERKFDPDDDNLIDGDELERRPLSPSYLSLLNHLRIYLPELFPELNKIILLDDDVVVQNDLSPLWELDLNGKVNGAVLSSFIRKDEHSMSDYNCSGKRYSDYLNFSNPLISANFEFDRCAWLYGMNVFDLKAWRSTNITQVYHSWLKLNLNSGFALWHFELLPPALIAFEGKVHPIDPSWHMGGLGTYQQQPKLGEKILKSAASSAVIHFSGPAKPWLEIGLPELRNLWKVYVNYSSEYLQSCNIMA